MKTFSLAPLTLFQVLNGVARAAGKKVNGTLPTGYFVAANVEKNEPAQWVLTVPEVWNFSTVLNATGRAHVLDNITSTLDDANIPFPGAHAEPPVIFINGTWSGYATNALNYEMARTVNASLAPYSEDNWVLPVVCEWPISGMYSRLNRILYYLLLVFALVIHHHEWLVAGALASATTYSGAAAVQAWVQYGVINSARPRDTAGDNDNEAIMGILAAGLLMAVPLINWSRTLRRLQARPILIYWAIIVFFGYLLVIIGEKQTEYANGWNKHAGGMMTCSTKQQLPQFKDLGFIEHDFISKYNCDDPCYNPRTFHPFHSGSSSITRLTCDLTTWTGSSLNSTETSCFAQCPREIADTCYLGHGGWTAQDFRLNNAGYYGVLPVAVFELFFVLCFGRMSPEEIRDLMFKSFAGRRLMGKYRMLSPEKRKGVPRMARVMVAQGVALLFYAFAAITYLVCIPFFIFSIVWQERLLRFFPDAEPYTEVGQWLPYVVVLLTLGAALVGKYHHVWHVYISHYVFGHKKLRSMPVTKAVDKGNDLAGWLRRSTWRTRSRLSLEWRDFIEFVKNPFFLVLDTSRERTSENPTVKYSFAGSLPYPEEHERNNKKNYCGPWVKNDNTWNDFNVEFFVEADDRTLKSWERYQHKTGPSTLSPSGEHIVYSVYLPPVPSHPDKRTVIADSNSPQIMEKVTPDPTAPNSGIKLTNAIVPGARKASTVSFGLHTLPDPQSTAVSSTAGSTTNSINGPTKTGTFVNQTAIPPSTMSSMNQPTIRTTTATPGADPNVSPLPQVQQPAASNGSHPAASGSSISSMGTVDEPTEQLALRRSNDATPASRPLLGRTSSTDSNPAT